MSTKLTKILLTTVIVFLWVSVASAEYLQGAYYVTCNDYHRPDDCVYAIKEDDPNTMTEWIVYRSYWIGSYRHTMTISILDRGLLGIEWVKGSPITLATSLELSWLDRPFSQIIMLDPVLPEIYTRPDQLAYDNWYIHETVHTIYLNGGIEWVSISDSGNWIVYRGYYLKDDGVLGEELVYWNLSNELVPKIRLEHFDRPMDYWQETENTFSGWNGDMMLVYSDNGQILGIRLDRPNEPPTPNWHIIYFPIIVR